MAFKMNRPSKMNGPKKSGLKLGRNKAAIGNELNADTTAFFYNSKMGPMQMVNPSALKQMEEEVDPDAPGTPGQEGYEPPVRREDLDEEGKRIFDDHQRVKEKAAKNDWETGSTLKEGDYATYGQQAYDFKGNKTNFESHEITGPVLINQHGRPYSEIEGSDELVFWSPVADKKGRPGSPVEDRVQPEWENADEVD